MRHQVDRSGGKDVVPASCRVQVVPKEVSVGIDVGHILRWMLDVSERVGTGRGNDAEKEIEDVKLVNVEMAAKVEIFENRDAGGEIAVE